MLLLETFSIVKNRLNYFRYCLNYYGNGMAFWRAGDTLGRVEDEKGNWGDVG